jgi:hypothetical protein
MGVPHDEDRDTTAFDPTALRALVGATKEPRAASPTIPMDDARRTALVDGEREAAPRPMRPRARQTALDPAIVVPGGARYLARGSTGVRPSRLRPAVAAHPQAEPARPPLRHRTSVLVVVAVVAALVGAATTYFY